MELETGTVVVTIISTLILGFALWIIQKIINI
jgi:hypothetical protein